jgi:hypothetical protein
MPQTKRAEVPVFNNQAFCFTALPLQVVQSWLLEQELESKDSAVQEVLQKMAQQFKSQPNSPLNDFQFDIHGALAYYLFEHNNKQFSTIYLPGSGLQLGWNGSTYYAIDKGIFIFTKALSAEDKRYFEQSLTGLYFQPQTFEARKHHFELRHQTYTLNWEEHAFTLELPTQKQKTRALQPAGFHLSCPIALSNLPASFRFLEGVSAASVNYYGAELNTKQALKLEFEALLSFDSQQERTRFLEGAQTAFPAWQWQNNFVRVNDAVYALKNEGSNQLFICSQPKKYIQQGQIKSRLNTSPIFCAGDPKLLTKLDNAGWAAAVLELFPIYRGISDFSARTATVSTTQNTIRWELKKEYFAAGEFLKLLGTISEK